MFFIWFIMIIVATAIGASKNRTLMGFLMGFLLGLIGVIIMLCVSAKEPEHYYNNYSTTPEQPKEPTQTIFKDEKTN